MKRWREPVPRSELLEALARIARRDDVEAAAAAARYWRRRIRPQEPQEGRLRPRAGN